MILLAMNKILGNLFFFFSLSSDVQKKETFFRVYFRLSFGVHFNTSSVFSLFRVCFPRFFWFHFSLLLCVHHGVDGCIIIIAGISFAPSSWLRWIVFSTLVL